MYMEKENEGYGTNGNDLPLAVLSVYIIRVVMNGWVATLSGEEMIKVEKQEVPMAWNYILMVPAFPLGNREVMVAANGIVRYRV